MTDQPQTTGPLDVTRLTAALEQNAADAEAILAQLDVASAALPEHAVAALRDRAQDIARHAAKALESEDAHRRDIAVRAQREDLVKRALVERIAQLDAARLVAATLAGHDLKTTFPDAAAEKVAWDNAEHYARQLGLSSAGWADARARVASRVAWAEARSELPVEAPAAVYRASTGPVDIYEYRSKPKARNPAKAKKATKRPAKAKAKRASKKGGK